MGNFRIWPDMVALGLFGGLLIGCATVSYAMVEKPKMPMVGFLKEGWHSGLILPVSELRGPLDPLKKWFRTARFVVIGWGDRRFYTAPHPGILAALGALFPSSSVLYVQGVQQPPQASRHTDLIWRRLSADGLHRLQDFLGRSFYRGPDGRLQPLKLTHVFPGLFFRAHETYDAFHTCNTWTVIALKHAGLPVHSQGVIFADQALAAVEAAKPAQSSGSP